MNNPINILVSDLAFKESREVILPHAYGTLRAYQQYFYPNLTHQIAWKDPLYEWAEIPNVDFLSVDLLALSCYVWNIKTQMEIARQFKELNPNGIVVCGGPQIPLHGGQYRDEYLFVDFWLFKEGEECFSKLIESLVLHGSLKTRELRQQLEKPVKPKIDNQSPYLMKIYDHLLEKKPDQNYTAMWESTRGCPFNCSFCNWGSYTSSQVRMVPQSRIDLELSWLENSRVSNLYITDANFGILPRDLEITKRLASIKQKTGNPKQVWANYNKNTNHRVLEINDILVKNGMSYTGATISVQSLSDEVLTNIGRENIGFNKYLNLDDQQQKKEIASYTELILGLPGETLQSFTEGIDKLVEKKIRNIRMYPALALKNTDFDNEQYIKTHGIRTQAKRIYLDQHRVGNIEVIERANVITETNSMDHQSLREMYRIGYLTQGLYSTGIIKLIFDQLISNKMSFSEFLIDLKNFKDPNFDELFQFLDKIITYQFDTDETNMFGAQFVDYPFKNKLSKIRAAPWNLIWLKIILKKSEFYGSLKRYLKSKFGLSENEMNDIFKLQDFLLMDLELWEKGYKTAKLPVEFLNKQGIKTQTGTITFKEKLTNRGSSLFDYLLYSTGSTVVTEFKFLIQKRDIADLETVSSAPL